MFNLKDATKSKTNDNEYISTKCNLQNEDKPVIELYSST